MNPLTTKVQRNTRRLTPKVEKKRLFMTYLANFTESVFSNEIQIDDRYIARKPYLVEP